MPANSFNSPTILAVDDSPVMQKTIQRILEKHYRVILADNALDALSTIYHESINVVLLDVSMPDIDGLEMCRTVRSLPQFQDLPIIMLTARDKAFDKVKGHLAGATEYLTKPFDGEQLLAVVGQYTHQDQPQASSSSNA
ncbi:response regulator [Geitlerinema sp. P-1104]|uniref:response regulator n=1 Tax=Geitlerinema sp. P-1104 TaxID=2546230 RepID=UPI0014775C57|nr:response regulator [Geitlerinema sp. P-1104]NMG59686.1 response regulator [Geitlerinema sp. P-1104]